MKQEKSAIGEVPSSEVFSEMKELRAKNKELEERLEESVQTLNAIQNGEVDAILVSTKSGDRIFTLKGAEEPYRILFEQMNESAVTISEDGGILYSNQNFARVMRTSLEKIIGTNLTEYVNMSSLLVFRELLCQSRNGPLRGDVVFEAMDGTLVPMQLSISFLPMLEVPTYCIVAADRTERIIAEDALNSAYEELELKVQERTSELQETTDALEETTARLEAILNKMPAAVVIIEPLDGKVVFFNDEVNRQFRRKAEPIDSMKELAKYPTFHLDGSQYIEKEYPLTKVLETGEEVLNEIVEFERADGTRGFVNSNAVPVKDPKGKITAVVGLRFEITDQIETERALARSNTELKQFAYVASHDLQEPLRMVISYLTLIERRYGDRLDDVGKDYIEFAVNGGKRMKALIDDLLEYSRVETKAQPSILVDLYEITLQTLKTFELKIEETGAEIIVERLPTVTGDEMQISQVLQNLISNALKFRSQDKPVIRISCSQDQDKWILAIKDNGIGLNMEYSVRIFQMFQRLNSDDDYEGTGVGLAIVKKIVERHGGKVWVESQEGKGATFFFSLPKN
ncbi:MAG: ATP-binding protein [Methanomassiliicoccales archaeon]|jgi:PAS domain S-box-containing protein